MSTSTKGLHDRGVQGVAVVTFVGASQGSRPSSRQSFLAQNANKGGDGTDQSISQTHQQRRMDDKIKFKKTNRKVDFRTLLATKWNGAVKIFRSRRFLRPIYKYRL